MVNKLKDPRYQLLQISDLFLEDLIAASDKELSDESGLLNGDKAKAAYARALQITGKKRLQAARTALENKPSESNLISKEMDIQQARQILEKLAANDPSFRNKITLAARNLREIPDSEVLSIILDLKRLGALPDENA